MKLYHGTSKENAAHIIEMGLLKSPVYLTPRKETALDYGEVVFEIEIDDVDLEVDFDLPAGKLTVQEANDYAQKDWGIQEYFDIGQSMGVPSDVGREQWKQLEH